MNLRPIFYDTETTGIRSDKDRIVEIAAFDPIRKRSFEKLVNPGCPIPSSASAIHNITDDMVKDCPDFSQIGKEFVEFCEGNVVLIAHNNDGFDIHFLKNEFNRHSIEMPTWNFLDSLNGHGATGRICQGILCNFCVKFIRSQKIMLTVLWMTFLSCIKCSPL